MKTRSLIAFTSSLILAVCVVAGSVLAEGVPEPGLILYGQVRNAAAGGILLTQGTITFTVQQVGGASVVVSTPLHSLPRVQSFRARVPFEVLLGSAGTLSASTFRMPSANPAFQITQVTFAPPSMGTTSLPLSALSTTSFNLTDENFRGAVRQVDVTVSIAGLAALADTDGDGMTDADELLAGTDPTDPDSKLFITAVCCPADGTAYVEWSSVPAKRYSVLRAAAAGSGEFTVVASGIVASEAVTAFIDTGATNSAAGFYRVKVEQ